MGRVSVKLLVLAVALLASAVAAAPSHAPFAGDLTKRTIAFTPMSSGAAPEELDEVAVSSSARIINGLNVLGHKMAPYVVSLYTIENGVWNFMCTGSIVDKDIVLTAAHCADDRETGIGVCTESTSVTKGRCVRVIARRIPEEWGGEVLTHDVALLKTAKNIVGFFRTAKVIPVDFDMDGPGEDGVVYGFGKQNKDATETDGKLRYVDVHYEPMRGCIKDQGIRIRNFFCVSGNHDGSMGGACREDIGGPLVASSGTLYPSRHKLIGVASFVYLALRSRGPVFRSCDPRIPMGFSMLAATEIKQWLRKNIKELDGRFHSD